MEAAATKHRPATTSKSTLGRAHRPTSNSSPPAPQPWVLTIEFASTCIHLTMNTRSWSEDFTVVLPFGHTDLLQPQHMRSWSMCDDMLYSSDDGGSDATLSNQFLPQATSAAEKCGYRTGKCFNVRTLKRNGKYHKLCEAHREKANLNQKKLDRKKRMRRFSPYEAPAMDECEEEDEKMAPMASPTSLDQGPVHFGFDEVEFFCDLMAHQHPDPCVVDSLDAVKEEEDAAVDEPPSLAKDEVLNFMQALLV
ncbi:Aste57867_415 [Aphanomyces stellatus]|uniref:Aste57867_415 protein n=1 Tax=Aphanomyces stellatus TaxID=120398 RepID=A0A485K2R2_9STRA|nr:hypothetical protein As57867_000414 [Aphanomyces stellatus]VFT77640.1 Aste57867_415 [Aphanomyces stellatus]